MPFEITKDFVEKLVNQPLTDVEVKAGCAPGDNVAGALKALTLTTAPGDKLYLVHKTFSDFAVFKKMAIQGRAFPVEVAVYSKLVPDLEDLFKASHVPHYKVPVPKFYAGFSDDENDYLTLEDLRPAGYKMADKYAGLTLAESSLAMRQLAIWHAATYCLLRYKGESWFDSNAIPALCPWVLPEMEAQNKMWLSGVMKYSLEVINSQNSDLGSKVAKKFAIPDIHQIMGRTIASTDKAYFPCIVHGDLWINNIMFQYDQAGEPTDAKFIDFQQTRRGNIFEDLQNFFMTSTTPQFRKSHLYTVLSIYYDTFAKTMKDLKCPMPIGFTIGKLFDGYSMCVFPGFLFAAFAIPMQLGMPHFPSGDGQGGQPKPEQSQDVKQTEEKKGLENMGEEFLNAGMMDNLKNQLMNTPAALKRYMDNAQEFIELDAQ